MNVCCCSLAGTNACKNCENSKVGCGGISSIPVFYVDNVELLNKWKKLQEKQGYKHKD